MKVGQHQLWFTEQDQSSQQTQRPTKMVTSSEDVRRAADSDADQDKNQSFKQPPSETTAT